METGGVNRWRPRCDKWAAARGMPDNPRVTMAGLLSVLSEFEQEILRERTRVGLAQVRLSGKRLAWPATAAMHIAGIRELHRAAVSKSEIARRVQTGRTSVRRLLKVEKGG